MKTETQAQGNPGPRLVLLVRPVSVKDLAEAIDIKPFRVVQMLMELEIFAHPLAMLGDEQIERFAGKYHYRFRIVDQLEDEPV